MDRKMKEYIKLLCIKFDTTLKSIKCPEIVVLLRNVMNLVERL